MEKQSTLEEFLNDNRKLSLAESSNEDTKSINGSETIYSDKKRKRFGIYKTLMGSGLASGLGYMLANAYLAPGLASPAFTVIQISIYLIYFSFWFFFDFIQLLFIRVPGL